MSMEPAARKSYQELHSKRAKSKDDGGTNTLGFPNSCIHFSTAGIQNWHYPHLHSFLARLSNREREKEKIWGSSVIVGIATNQQKSKRWFSKTLNFSFLISARVKVDAVLFVGDFSKRKEERKR
eukprot:TRINITY_DN7261_c0_g2_i9.p2 TRINITY_DN7261_c0_g2~~TRINITY_DN7261_c0_g2_i9.p2  ORF type:complete len:124 (+),score=19.18 TRINITY_DN7261_c0_g2_i9:831-1202(+)